MGSNQWQGHELHPLVYLGTLLYALTVLTLLFLYVQWAWGPLLG